MCNRNNIVIVNFSVSVHVFIADISGAYFAVCLFRASVDFILILK